MYSKTNLEFFFYSSFSTHRPTHPPHAIPIRESCILISISPKKIFATFFSANFFLSKFFFSLNLLAKFYFTKFFGGEDFFFLNFQPTAPPHAIHIKESFSKGLCYFWIYAFPYNDYMR